MFKVNDSVYIISGQFKYQYATISYIVSTMFSMVYFDTTKECHMVFNTGMILCKNIKQNKLPSWF